MKILRFLLLTALLMLSIKPIFPQTAGFVKTEGQFLIEPGGNKVILRGINLGNWLNPEGYMFHFKDASSAMRINRAFTELMGPAETQKFWKTFRDNYITGEDIFFIKKLGLNSIRLPFNFRLFVSESYPSVYNEEGFKYLDKAVEWCREAGIYLILDMHAAPGGQTGDNIDDSWGFPFLFESPEMQNIAVDLWKKIAEKYKEEKIIIGYDLLNEPIPHFYDQAYFNPKLEPLYKKMVAAVREVDSNHVIFLGGAQWNTNFKVFGPPFDANVVYTFHKYWMPTEQKEIQEYVDYSEKYNVPLWLGESGENTDEWVNSFRELLEKNNIGWCFWPYKKMDAQSCIASFARPAGWDKIIEYADNPRAKFEDIRNSRPDKEIIEKAFSELLEKIKFFNCIPNSGYIKALGVK